MRSPRRRARKGWPSWWNCAGVCRSCWFCAPSRLELLRPVEVFDVEADRIGPNDRFGLGWDHLDLHHALHGDAALFVAVWLAHDLKPVDLVAGLRERHDRTHLDRNRLGERPHEGVLALGAEVVGDLVGGRVAGDQEAVQALDVAL